MKDERFEYRIARAEDRQIIIDFLLKYFHREEPLGRSSGMSEEEFLSIASRTVDASLKDSFSTVVRCKDTGAIVGILLNSVCNRGDTKQVNLFEDAKESVAAFGWILSELHNSFFELVPDHVMKVLHMEMSSVGKPYQRQGIATKMMNFSYSREKMQEYGIDGIMSETTSFANQKLLAKHGYKPLKVIQLDVVKGSQGEQLLRPDDGTEKAVLNWKPTEELAF